MTCLCDAFYGEVGIAAVRVLEHAGCEVQFEKSQTCCGQPPFNSGSWEEARKVATRCRTLLAKRDVPIVAPSASCAAMLRDGYPMLFPDEPPLSVHELSQFLVHEMGVASWPGAKPYRKLIAVHRACHGRAIGLQTEVETLLTSIPGLRIVPIEHPEQCCGFGGAFSVTQVKLSAGIGLEKLKRIEESGAEEIVSGDMGCLMHLKGLMQRHGMDRPVRHFAEILAEVVAK